MNRCNKFEGVTMQYVSVLLNAWPVDNVGQMVRCEVSDSTKYVQLCSGAGAPMVRTGLVGLGLGFDTTKGLGRARRGSGWLRES